MRAVEGVLGKTNLDGAPADADPTARLIRLLNRALAKPSADQRLIFIDVNAEPPIKPTEKPTWVDLAVKRLEAFERRTQGVEAYIFVTNMPFHRALDREFTPVAAVPFGLGMMDFNRPGFYRLSETYRRKQKHRDVHDIAETMARYPQIPSTFDGALPSELYGRASSRVLIGETYNFEDLGEGGIIGTVTTATVSEIEKQVYLGIVDQRG